MTCPTCGTANADGSAFCANCGSNLAAATPVATAAAPAPAPPAINDSAEVPVQDDLLDKVKQHLGADYAIDKELGRGGMAVVYKGTERALERIVAIKVVPPESANAGQAAERFRREARLAASLDHANIIPVYRVGTAGPLHFMAMKFVEGRAVDAIIESQGALPIPVALAVLRYSAAGLAFAHEKKIVHRDIKGANILVDKDGRVMVSDFGIARALEEVSLTASGMVIGTPYYMSPEQCGGQKISPQSDQYSLGILGFQMLTGEVPFNADSMVGVIQHHYMTPVPDIRQVRSDVPQELLDIIYCSLNKAPEDRFTTTKEMAQALEAVPQSEQDREEAERLLRELSTGKAIPKVRTGTLPPLSLTISGPSAPVVARPVITPRKANTGQGPAIKRKKKKKKNKMMMPAAAAIVLLGGGGFYMNYVQTQETAKQQAAQATRDSLAKEARKARIIVGGLPTSEAVLLVNNVQYKNGDTIVLDPGTHAGQAMGRGLAAVSPVTLQVDSGEVRDFDPAGLALEATGGGGGANSNQTNFAGGNQQGTTRPGGGGGGGAAAVADSGELRLTVTPNTATIWVDNVQVGTGRKFYKTQIGPHNVRFTLTGCTAAELRLDVKKGEATTHAQPLSGPDCK